MKRLEISDQLQWEWIWHYKNRYKLVRIQRFQIMIFNYRSSIHIEYRLRLLSLISIFFQIKLINKFYIKLKRIIILFNDKTFIKNNIFNWSRNMMVNIGNHSYILISKIYISWLFKPVQRNPLHVKTKMK